MSYGFLIHGARDHVGVAVRDLNSGEEVVGVHQKRTSNTVSVRALQNIPLGHKIALVDINAGEEIIKYDEVIGVAVEPIERGQHVHVHNIKSVRWA